MIDSVSVCISDFLPQTRCLGPGLGDENVMPLCFGTLIRVNCFIGRRIQTSAGET